MMNFSDTTQQFKSIHTLILNRKHCDKGNLINPRERREFVLLFTVDRGLTFFFLLISICTT